MQGLWKRTAITAGLMATMILWMAFPAYAKEENTVSVTIPVEQVFTNHSDGERENTLTYCLSAQENGFPLPGGQTGTDYYFSMTGTEGKKLEPITFSQPGVYTYQVSLYEGEKEGNTYDETVYTVVVQVKDKGNGERGAETVLLDSRGEKNPVLEFQHSYSPGSGRNANTTVKPADIGKTDGNNAAKISVKTGDNSRPMAFFAMIMGSTAAAVILFQTRRKPNLNK